MSVTCIVSYSNPITYFTPVTSSHIRAKVLSFTNVHYMLLHSALSVFLCRGFNVREDFQIHMELLAAFQPNEEGGHEFVA